MKTIVFICLCCPLLLSGQWALNAKADKLAQLATLHQIKLNTQSIMDSASLVETAQEFIYSYYFGKAPSHLAYNGLNNEFGEQMCQQWTKEFIDLPLLRSLPLIDKSVDQLANFKRWIVQYDLQKYVIVNIASNELLAYENDSLSLKMKVIVGTKKHQTPVMASYADAVMIYPYWTPTPNIVFNEIIPKVIDDSSYLSRNNFEVLDRKKRIVDPYALDWSSFNRKNFPYTIRQGTGCDNSLGLLKINIKNPYSIYLHDTPHTAYSKGLFDKEKRFFSHGCIRLEKPLEIANWLNPKKLIDEALMETCLLNQKPEVISLQEQVPIFLMYFTNYQDENGEWIELEDYYGIEE